MSEVLDNNLFATQWEVDFYEFRNVSKSGRGHFKLGTRYTKIVEFGL